MLSPDDKAVAQKQYEVYVRTAEALVDRRADANKFYLSLNTALAGVGGFLLTRQIGVSAHLLLPALGIGGIVICLIWRAILVSQRRLLGRKFNVIHDMERRLPFQPYIDEYQVDGEGRGKPSFAVFELGVPVVFMLFYAALLATVIVTWPAG